MRAILRDKAPRLPNARHLDDAMPTRMPAREPWAGPELQLTHSGYTITSGICTLIYQSMIETNRLRPFPPRSSAL